GYPRGVATHRRDARAASFANNASSRLRKWPEKWPENALWGISGHFGSGSLSWGGSSRRVRLGRASRPYRPHITEFETGLPSTTVTGSYSAAAQSGTVGRCCLRCRETAGQPLTFPTSPPPRRLRLLVPLHATRTGIAKKPTRRARRLIRLVIEFCPRRKCWMIDIGG